MLAHPAFAFAGPQGFDWLYIGFFLLILLLPTALWIGALISCIKNEDSGDSAKIAWILVILLSHFFGALIYLLYRRPRRIRELGH